MKSWRDQNWEIDLSKVEVKTNREKYAKQQKFWVSLLRKRESNY